MSDFDRNYASLRGVATDRAVAYDMGLRAHMIRVYNYMAGGVALTGVVAWLTYQMAVVTNASGAITGLTPFGHTLFMVYTSTSITRVFFISAASFGALSLYGYTTKRSLDAMGSFLMMGVIGLLIAMVVNMFLGSSMLQWMISILGVGIFAGLTAWDTQKIKEFYDPMDDGTVAGRKAVMGALSLYLDFLNMFQFLLQLVGDRR